MNTDTQQKEYATRHAILQLLSDDEVARVSMKEAGPRLVDGDEYVDLEHLNMGVLRVQASTQMRIGNVLPRSAVADTTWSKICAELARDGA